ncbi:hypothetical protein [Pedobacter faecalis]|uniref:hypothetical protein n=1 Tax=Pedobacter faecalis TaxID=3041495 RepID=UPI00254B4699|nr:hypothetical protein [Pedobacter sp. ELA7]
MEESKIFDLVTQTLNRYKVHTLQVRLSKSPAPTVEVLPQKWWERLIGRRPRTIEIPPSEQDMVRKLEIWPARVSTQYRVAALSDKLVKTAELEEELSGNFRFVNANQPLIVEIVATAIQNDGKEPDPELIAFIEENVFGEDLYTALRAVFDNYGMQSFTNSIVLMKGTVKILKPKTSPTDGTE